MTFSDQLRKPQVLTLVIPFLAMIAMIGINRHNVTAHTEYRFQIEGYDPRDILRGHFLTFRYVWPEGSVDQSACDVHAATPDRDCCAFISGDAAKANVTFGSCRVSSPAGAGLAVAGPDHQPDMTLRQYYIPEEQAPDLEARLRGDGNRFEVGLVMRPDGAGQLKMLYIDGKPLPDFLRDPVPVEVQAMPNP